MDKQKEKDIKYKSSEVSKNTISNPVNYISNIKSEDDLLSNLEQLKSENKYEECIALIEQQLPSLEKNYSKEHEKFYQLAYEITDICNLKAYDLFLNSKPEEGLKFIEKSIQIFSNYKQILNICYANLGKYYIKLNKMQKAIDCFLVSTEIARSLKNKLHVAQGHLLLANVLLNTDSILLAIEQALSGIILLQEIIINKEEYKDNTNILEALEDAYLIVAVGKYKNGNIIQSLLYCKLAEQLQQKIGKNKNEKDNKDKESNKKNKKNKKEGELNILEDETKYELIKNALNFDLDMDKALFDKNEQMSNNYILNILKTMMEDIEIKIKSKKNDNEFFISQMNPNPENNNEENNNILSNNNIIQPINNNITYDDTNIVEEMINKNIK
jgi:hypothetical protein